MPEIIIKGFAEFDRKLKELEASMERKALIEVAKAGAQILVDAARANAPKDTGALAAGIAMQTSNKESDIHEATVNVGYNKKQFYGLFVDRGTGERVNKKGKHSGRTRPTFFLERALETNRERIIATMKARMEEIIARVVKS